MKTTKSRNILITGDYDRFDQTNHGLHTLSVGGDGSNVYGTDNSIDSVTFEGGNDRVTLWTEFIPD